MSERDLSIYIKDIIENMNKAESFVSGLTYRDFGKDEKVSYAVIRCVEIIGEAAKHVPEKIRKKYPKIPWRDMAGMRDKVMHFYFGLDLKKVWLVVKKDIPQLKPLVVEILENMKRSDR